MPQYDSRDFMKIWLIPKVLIHVFNPRFSIPYIPLGLLSVASVIDRSKHKVEILDLTKLVRDGVIEFDENFEREAAEFINTKKFDVVGFSTLSANYHHTLKVVEVLKEISPQTKIILGGAQVSFCDALTLKNFPADIAVRGEAELTVHELLNAIETGAPPDNINGITFKTGGTVRRNSPRAFVKDIDTLPIPAYDLYPIDNFSSVPIEGTRGCPFHCVYCSTT